MKSIHEKKYNAVYLAIGGIKSNEPGSMINRAKELNKKVVINKMEPRKRTAFMGMI